MQRQASSRPYGKIGKLALTEPEVELLLSSITKLDDDALLSLAISSGIRREDIVKISLSNIQEIADVLRIIFWEGKKSRNWTVFIGGATKQKLLQHIGKLPKTEHLFPSYNPKEHICGKTAYNILQRWLKKAGLSSIPFHALRATCIKLAKKRGWDIEDIMQLTGDSFRTIKIHYDVPSEDEMKEVADKKPIL